MFFYQFKSLELNVAWNCCSATSLSRSNICLRNPELGNPIPSSIILNTISLISSAVTITKQLKITRTPCGFSKLVLAVVYYPGRTSPVESDGPNLLNHLFDSLTRAEALFTNCGIVIVGDLNRLNTTPLQNHFNLKHLVKFPTRGQATLDLFPTNMYDYFSAPECFPPFGLSHHATIIVKPKIRPPNQHTRKSIIIRNIRESNKASLGRYFAGIDWSCVTDHANNLRG